MSTETSRIIQSTLADLRRKHVPASRRSTTDELLCRHDHFKWPCDTAIALSATPEELASAAPRSPSVERLAEALRAVLPNAPGVTADGYRRCATDILAALAAPTPK